LARFDALQAYYSIAGRDLEREIVPLLASEKVGLLVLVACFPASSVGQTRRPRILAAPNMTFRSSTKRRPGTSST
jgi:aryl-alcohol dehydrogenase-like predicted oxidoreductase